MDRLQDITCAQEGNPCPYAQKYEDDKAQDVAAKVADRLLGKRPPRTASGALHNALNEALNNGSDPCLFSNRFADLINRNKPKPTVWKFPFAATR